MSQALERTDQIFFSGTEMEQGRAIAIVQDGLKGAEDGELYLEYRQSDFLLFEDGRLKNANFDTQQGFGLRSVAGETVGYAHSSELSEAALRRAISTVQMVHRGYGGNLTLAPAGTNRQLYGQHNPVQELEFAEKVRLLQQIDTYLRSRDVRVRQVSCSLSSNWQAVQILRPDGRRVADIRPLTRLNVSVIAGEGSRQEAGSFGLGGRAGLLGYIQENQWRHAADEALRIAIVNLRSRPAPAGEMEVVLGPGWPGVLLHEAIGHGLEGDVNRMKTSAFYDLMGQRVAAPGVTVVDDGTLAERRGSLTIDDEGTPTACTPLIENGILVGYLQDRQNGRLMRTGSTGNGRRQSYAHVPMPRMTNTYMLAGTHQPDEIIRSVKKGLYAVNFGGGQVDTTSGKFVFSASEAYLIENGEITHPVKGATLIGNGPDILTKVAMIGSDLKLDEGIGTCGKAGQSVPVGVGQPSLKISAMTVGGTAA